MRTQNCLVAVSDNNYLDYAIVLFMKLRNLGCKSPIFLLADCEISDDKLKVLGDLEVRVIPILEIMETLPELGSSGYISRTTYAKFLIPELLPIEFDKALYIDTDMLVYRNPEILFDREIHNPIAAVPEFHQNGWNLFKTVEETYFNAGLILFNLVACREMGIRESFQELFEIHGNMQFLDQNYFNLIFRQNWTLLPLSCNVFADVSNTENSISGLFDPMIVHFTGVQKPWNTKSRDAHFLEWQKDARDYGLKLNFKHSQNATLMQLINSFRNSRIGKFMRRKLPTHLKIEIWNLINFVRK
jgi:lipopolysaccharide biosynthesis glycosyltransferase